VVKFDVTVEEALTGRSQNVSANIILHKHKYKMDLIKTSEYFKPGLRYSAFVSSIRIIIVKSRAYNLKTYSFSQLIYIFFFLPVSDQIKSPRRYAGVRRQEPGESPTRSHVQQRRVRGKQTHVAQKRFDPVGVLSADKRDDDRHRGEYFTVKLSI